MMQEISKTTQETSKTMQGISKKRRQDMRAIVAVFGVSLLIAGMAVSSSLCVWGGAVAFAAGAVPRWSSHLPSSGSDGSGSGNDGPGSGRRAA